MTLHLHSVATDMDLQAPNIRRKVGNQKPENDVEHITGTILETLFGVLLEAAMTDETWDFND